MERYIEIALTRRQARCVARLHDDLAPRTCEALWEALPVQGDAFHGKYARNEVYTLVSDFAPEPPGQENTTITPIPGDVCAFWFPGRELASVSHGYPSGQRPDSAATIVDLALFYERNNLLLNPDVGWVPGNVFATIVEGLDTIATACNDLWLNGVAGEQLSITRVAR